MTLSYFPNSVLGPSFPPDARLFPFTVLHWCGISRHTKPHIETAVAKKKGKLFPDQSSGAAARRRFQTLRVAFQRMKAICYTNHRLLYFSLQVNWAAEPALARDLVGGKPIRDAFSDYVHTQRSARILGLIITTVTAVTWSERESKRTSDLQDWSEEPVELDWSFGFKSKNMNNTCMRLFFV